ncbi:hypothetical protein TFLX_01134 [Thermoflexales bacterium]|nr:hypothetical protein TFLX_01134 [Thermoflexales bacterium]
MSPDIDWHVGEGAERETITNASPLRRSRRRWIALLLVVILGVGLGTLYRSLPEPAPQPTPLPSATPHLMPSRPAIPAKLFETIDREAQALADGDFDAYLDTQASSTQNRLEVQRQNFVAWGWPQGDRPLYTLVDFNLLTVTSAWVDIRQFREGRYFRETRFYYCEGERWLHGSTNRSLWSGQEGSLQTSHFDVTYAIEDRDVLSPTLRQLEEDYQALCRDLGCTVNGQELTFTLKVKPVEGYYLHSYPVGTGNVEIRLNSLRAAGFFESGRAYTWKSGVAPHWALAEELGQRVYGLRFEGATGYEQAGSGLLWAAICWAIDRVDPLPADLFGTLNDLQQRPLLSLETLWEIGEVYEPGLALTQLYHLLRFIEQEYGASAVTRLLGAIDSAKSMSEAIETGLGVSFAEFDQKWQAWVKQN